MSDTQPEATSQNNSSRQIGNANSASPWAPRLHPEWIDSHATGIVKALQKAGHESYLVGGCVRDILVGRTPKDFDVATSAAPNEIKSTFRNSRSIRPRFRLAHLCFDQ